MAKFREVAIVDDSDTDLLYTSIVLERAAIADQVRTFGTGHDALAHLQRAEGHAVDLLLLDINMPEMDGFEFLTLYEASADAAASRTAVVMLTSSDDPADRRRALAFGCVKGYLTKPIDPAAARGLLDLAG